MPDERRPLTYTFNSNTARLLLFLTTTTAALLIILFNFSPAAAAPQAGKSAQKKSASSVPAPTPALLKRTTTRTETRRLGYGGSVTLYGAPEGSITVEAWTRGEVEVTADVEISAGTEEELALLASVNGFVLDDDYNHVRVVTTGTHDRKYLKRAARDLPKKLLALPWKIDYRLKVPASVDLEIYAGRGPLSLSGVEGAIRLYAPTSAGATLSLAGGDVEATLGTGPVNVRVPARSWRGRGMNLRVVSGELNVELPPNYSGDIDAHVLRAGRVRNDYNGLAPRERTAPTERSLQARSGHGGATLSFTLGDGTLRIKQEGGKQ
jgi:hypothetical protein